jgi:hypothetical protein
MNARFVPILGRNEAMKRILNPKPPQRRMSKVFALLLRTITRRAA